MSRLTQPSDSKFVVNCNIDDECNGQCGECKFNIKIRKKLKCYEDLEEQCVKDNLCGLHELCEKWKAFFDDIVELLDYRKKKEKGLLIEVLVKPGDDIYFIKLHFNGASRLGKITIDKITIDAFEIRVRGFWYDWNQEVSFTLKEFKKTWFLTEAEAEEALAKMGGSHDTGN